jgi:hypothetical protein
MVNLIVSEDRAVPRIVVADPQAVIGDKLN